MRLTIVIHPLTGKSGVLNSRMRHRGVRHRPRRRRSVSGRPGNLPRALTGFYLWLTDLRPGGNPAFRNLCVMTPQLTPASGREDSVFPPARRANNGTLTVELPVELRDDLGVRPGESDPTRMLSGVLLLVIATVTMALALAWWLI